MKNTIKKLALPIIVIGLLLGLSQTALGAGNFVTTAGVHIRSEASADSKSLDTVSKGTTVTVLEQDPAGWSKVQVGRLTGYIRSDFLKFNADNAGAVFTTTAGVHVRSSASAESKSLTTVSANTSVTVLEHDPAGWSKVQVGSVTGYIRSDFLRHAAALSAPAGDNTQAASGSTDTGTVIETRQVLGNVNLRSDASDTSNIIKLLQSGTSVDVLAHESSGWSRVTYNGQTGYIRTDLFTPVAASAQTASQTLYTTGNVNFRNSASSASSANIIRTLSKGTAVSVTGTEGKWSKVTHNDTVGYIQSDLLTPSLESSQSQSQTRYTVGNVNMRTSASDKSSIIMTVPKNAAVTVTSTAGEWSGISYDGKAGFAMTKYLIEAPPTGGDDGTIIAVMRVKPSDGANFRSGPSSQASKITALPIGTEVGVIANESNGWSRVKYGSKIGYIKSELLHAGGTPVELVTMSQITHLLPLKKPIRVVDVRTGVSYNISIYSKGKHADYEPSTLADTEAMYSVRNGVRSWAIRPVWVYVGDRVFAASTHGMPHDVDFIGGNGINGHLCLHFAETTTNSKSYQANLRAGVQEAWDKRPR